ncbi:cytochrome P450 [Artemisia annua]|uniref:Cytochrome P450 n=1 Tax=Artemisia annua TaxID=35608 RepID=A0A2U1NVN7_ARTAN|nr:cytochrome P450 [Artemisia annua]
MAQLNNDEITVAVVVVTLSVVILAMIWSKILSSSLKGAPPLPPGPRSLPIVGYLPFLSHELHKQFTNMAHTYGPIFKFKAGSKLHIVISTPELVKEVVRDQDENFSNRNATIAASTFSYGSQDVIWSDNNLKWRSVRKIFVQQVLSNENLQACSSFRRDEVRKTINNVFSRIGTTIDISEVSFSTEAHVITGMVWENASVDSHLVAQLQMVVSKVVELLGKPNMSDFFPSLARLDLQSVERDMKRELQRFDRIINMFIDGRIKANSKESKEALQHEGKKDFLQILLELKDQKDAKTSLSMTQIKALLLNTNVMKRLSSGNFSENFIFSNIGHNLLVPSDNCSLKKGFLTNLTRAQGPKRCKNLAKHDPDKGTSLGNNLKFFPFGSGRRLCPGYALAEKMQMYILASLFHSFDWTLPKGEEHDLSEKFGITLKKRKPLMAVPSQRLSDVSLYM